MEEKFKETFLNIYKDKWWYDYDSKTDIGILWGTDVEYQKYYIFNGICPDLVLDNDEKEWLKKVWLKHKAYDNDYFNIKETEIGINYCPICLKRRKVYEGHHCIPASEGGSDDNVNILNICTPCHSNITSGRHEDSYAIFNTCVMHQIMKYGIDFYKMNPNNNQRFKKNLDEYSKKLYKLRPHIKKVLEYYDSVNDLSKENFNIKLKEEARYYYKYYRSIVAGFIMEE